MPISSTIRIAISIHDNNNLWLPVFLCHRFQIDLLFYFYFLQEVIIIKTINNIKFYEIL